MADTEQQKEGGLSYQFDYADIAATNLRRMMAITLERDWRHSRQKIYVTSVKDPIKAELPFTIIQEHINDDSSARRLYEAGDANCMMLIWYFDKSVYAYFSGSNADATQAMLNGLLKILPEAEEEDRKITANFWHYGEKQSEMMQRQIDIPLWNEIESNYASATVESLETVFSAQPGEMNGQLILWHGLPGTGKTFALRALGRHWAQNAEFHYIIDPDVFFKKPAYMMDVIMRTAESDKYKFIVLEDAGEMLSADAKEREGQGLSRLLNIVDGILGQGLKLMILITTNEELQSMHPAVSREGRCAAITSFEALEPSRADAWLQEHGQGPQGRFMTLSELYETTVETKTPRPAKRKVGFV